ncbi:hypothetical protein [Mailhella massiliensis]|uniref:Uncharacterized protein n=1 Tax=Mailhella massiliensis TaxID=1903261 RepID=A0A921DR48_9BACT|nr:hypothetical protein [Mailhella massiliensis]HJD96603.1 hypothetical protein [Mailhella massiliensis]
MTFYTCAALAVLLFIGLAGAVLPFVCVWDHRLAVARRRSLYDKSAGQTEHLTAALHTVFALGLAADFLADGFINRLMDGPWLFLWEGLVLSSALATFCSVAVLLAGKKGRLCFSVLSGLVAMFAATLLTVLAWAFCLGAFTAGAGDPEEAVTAFLVLLAGLRSLGFALFAAFAVCLALASAYALALCWHILCRGMDDFGRDYYTFTLAMRSRQALCSGLLLTVSAASLFWLHPVVDGAQSQGLLPFAGAYAPQALTAGMFFLPLAALLWYAISRSALPMQRRSLAFLALPMLLAGVYAVLGRI